MDDQVETTPIRRSETGFFEPPVETALATIKQEDNQNQRFEISPEINPITPDSVKQLINLPWEFSIHEDSGNLVLAVGKKGNPQSSDELEIPEDTRLFLHTHSSTSDNTFLSMADIFNTGRYGRNAQLILATKQGLVVFTRPQHDPLREAPTRESPRELMYEWGKRNNVDFYGSGDNSERQNFFKMEEDEQIKTARRFCEDHKMIVREVDWEDSEGVSEIFEAINLRKTISNNESPRIPSLADKIDQKIEELGLEYAQQATLKAAIKHFDAIMNRQGVLYYKHDMRAAWRDFAHKLLEEIEAEGIGSQATNYINALREKAARLTVD